ncbi:MAG TPA: lysophospholipase [Kofleriaceae bacterium]|nr:lysophospholipase [Kofleriaceae bacterium]
MKEETFEGVGGVSIFMRSWRPTGKPRAVLVSVHGFKAYGGLFDWAGAQFASRGLAVYNLDLRGHGRSGGARLEVDKFADYLADVGQLVDIARERDPGLPIYVLGHSAGGVISLHYVRDHQREIAGFICHSFAQEVPAPDVVLALVRGISHLAPHIGVLDLKDEGFSRDAAFVERMKTDPLMSHAKYPAHTVAELARADDRMKEEFDTVTLPVLIMHGTVDSVTVPHGSQMFYDNAGSADKTLKLYEGHYHDLLNDLGKEQVLDDVVAWIAARVESRA